jgi:hypothetical protein
MSVWVCLPSGMPAQWNLFIPFHRGEISVALISLGRSLFHRGEAYSSGVANYKGT